MGVSTTTGILGQARRRRLLKPHNKQGHRMDWFSFRSAVACALAAVVVALAAPAHAEKRVALVVGNNDYRNVPKLQKAVNDARTMGDTLKQLGFNVMVAENQNRQQFSRTLL